MQVHIRQLGPGMVQQMQSVCSECSGKGETINPKLRCKTCLGKKTVDDHKILEVHVDKGKLVILYEYKYVYCIFILLLYLYHLPPHCCGFES
jgi:hypothetical protein